MACPFTPSLYSHVLRTMPDDDVEIEILNCLLTQSDPFTPDSAKGFSND